MLPADPYAPPRAPDLEPDAGPGGVDAEALHELVAAIPWARRCGHLATAMAVLCALALAISLGRGAGDHWLTMPFLLLGGLGALWFRRVFTAYARHGLTLAVGNLRGLDGALRAQRDFFRGLGLLLLLLLLVSMAVGFMMGRARGGA